jgi:hypothetical protein
VQEALPTDPDVKLCWAMAATASQFFFFTLKMNAQLARFTYQRCCAHWRIVPRSRLAM